MYVIGFTATCILCRTNQDADRGFWVSSIAYRDDCHVSCIQSLLLGGGFGFLTGQHGLVIDNLLQVCPSLLPERRCNNLTNQI